MSFSEMKQQAKNILKDHWGPAIIVIVIVAAIESIPSSGLVGDPGGFMSLTSIIALALMPLSVGSALFFVNLAQGEEADISLVLKGFKDGKYWKNLGTMILMSLFIFLWMLLFIIPGIIKAFSYALTPYILGDSDYENLEYTDVLQKSTDMMKGHKAELFMLMLSFILWFLLIPLTLGIATFYVAPYVSQTMAIFYLERKKSDTGIEVKPAFETVGKDEKQPQDEYFYE